MPVKTYKISEDEPMIVAEPAVAYGNIDGIFPVYTEHFSSEEWNPNEPFHGTQEEWWEHFHRIEEGQFYPVTEVHQRISEWIYNQKK